MDDLMRHLNMSELPTKREPVGQNAVQQADAFPDAARNLLSPSSVAVTDTQADGKLAVHTPSEPVLTAGRLHAPRIGGSNANVLRPARVQLLQPVREMALKPPTGPSQYLRRGANVEILRNVNALESHNQPEAGGEMEGIVRSRAAPPHNAPSQPAIMPNHVSDNPQHDDYALYVSRLNNQAIQKGHRVMYDIYKKSGKELYYGSVHVGRHVFDLRHPQDAAGVDARDAKAKLAKLGLQKLSKLPRGDLQYQPKSLAKAPAGYQGLPVPNRSNQPDPVSTPALLHGTDLNYVSLLNEWTNTRPGGTLKHARPEFKLSREPATMLKPVDSCGWSAILTIPEFPMRTFGSGKRYLPLEKLAKQVAAKQAVEWLIQAGHLTNVGQDGHVRKRKASPGRNGYAQLETQERSAKRVASGPVGVIPVNNEAGRKPEPDEVKRARERDRQRERGRLHSRANEGIRPREWDGYPPRSLDPSPDRYRPGSRNRSRDRERNRDSGRDRSYGRDRDRQREKDRDMSRERARDQERYSDRLQALASRPSSTVHASAATRPSSNPNAEVSVPNTPTGNDDYASKVERLAALLDLNQPVVYFMPSDPILRPNSVFSGSVHFHNQAAAGTVGEAVVQIRDEPAAGADAAKQLLYKKTLAWLQKQQDDRERALEEQLQKLREFKALKTIKDEPMQDAEQ